MLGKISLWAIADGHLVKKMFNMLLPLGGNDTICEGLNIFENLSFGSNG